MKKYSQTNYICDPNNHMYICDLVDEHGNHFYGDSRCHPEDRDFESETIGYTIAEYRANIKAIRHHYKNEIIPTLKAFYHLWDSMNQSKHFNPRSYEARRIRRTIKILEADLEVYKDIEKGLKEFVKAYVQGKDDYHAAVRRKRNQIRSESNN